MKTILKSNLPAQIYISKDYREKEKMKLLIMTIGLLAGTSSFGSHLQCDSDQWADFNCRLINPTVTSTAESYHTEFTVNYNFACGTGSFASTIYVASGGTASPVLHTDQSGSVKLEGYGPLSLKDEPAITAEEMFNKGCKLTITSVNKRPSSIALQSWRDEATGLATSSDLAIATITSLEAVAIWYELYIKDEINSSVLESIIARLADKTDISSKLQVKKLKEIIEQGEELDLASDIEKAFDTLVEMKEKIETIKTRFETAGLASESSIDAALDKLNTAITNRSDS